MQDANKRLLLFLAAFAAGYGLAYYIGRPAILPLKSTVKKGDKGKDINALQAALRDMGIDIEVNGVFDKKTALAVNRVFERTSGLKDVKSCEIETDLVRDFCYISENLKKDESK